MGRRLFWLVFALAAVPSESGSVVSRLQRPAVGSSALGAAGAASGSSYDVDEFRQRLQLLLTRPRARESVRALHGYIQRFLLQPRRYRRVCLWEPALASLLKESPALLQCLQAAGFEEDVGADGAPCLVMRRGRARILRRLASICAQELEALGVDSSLAPPADASTVDGATAEGGRAESGGVRRPSRNRRPAEAADPETAASQAERQLIEQLQSMISSLIGELEQHGVPSPS